MKTKDTSYAFAVAKTRAFETKLLSHQQIEQLIGAESAGQVLEQLAAAGWNTEGGDYDVLLNRERENTWDFVNELCPNSPELSLLTVRNDYHNLKTVLKALAADRDPKLFFMQPASMCPDEVLAVCTAKKFDELPGSVHFREMAQGAWELLMRTMDGQLLDTYLDCGLMEEMLLIANACESTLIRRYAAYQCDMANIQFAYRGAAAQKSQRFLRSGLCTTNNLNAEMLAAAAARGTEECLSYLDTTVYAAGSAMLRHSGAAFEKWSDDGAIALISEAKQISFGVEPVFAYYVAKENELRALRIILVCKESGASVQTITERMRELYV